MNLGCVNSRRESKKSWRKGWREGQGLQFKGGCFEIWLECIRQNQRDWT